MKKGLLFAGIGCFAVIVIIGIILVSMYINTYNKIVTLEEEVNGSWAQVQNMYQRRFDLIPNLVETVKGYAAHEKETFQAVTEARAKAGGVMNVSEEVLNDPALFQKFQQAQNSLGGALQRLLVTMERYPELKANQNFIRLQDELAGTENRIAVERKRFNDQVKIFNQTIRRFPASIIAGMMSVQTKPFFEAPQEAAQAPKVEF